jgi:uncharacterized protein YceH (UPF0502 family)
MSMAEYEKAYAEARAADIEARIEALKVEVANLTEERKRYAPAKRTRSTSDDKS